MKKLVLCRLVTHCGWEWTDWYWIEIVISPGLFRLRPCIDGPQHGSNDWTLTWTVFHGIVLWPLRDLLGLCSCKASLNRHRPVYCFLWVDTSIHSVVLSSAFWLIITGRSYYKCWVGYHDELCSDGRCDIGSCLRVMSVAIDECDLRGSSFPSTGEIPHHDCIQYGRAAT